MRCFCRTLNMREDGRQQVCCVGLKEVPVLMVETVHELIAKGNAARSTGSTGANEESSRSHAILQMVIKQQRDPDKGPIRRPRRSMGFMEAEKEPQGKLIGKFSFIDLAGSERGADTTDNDKQTRYVAGRICCVFLFLNVQVSHTLDDAHFVTLQDGRCRNQQIVARSKRVHPSPGHGKQPYSLPGKQVDRSSSRLLRGQLKDSDDFLYLSRLLLC